MVILLGNIVFCLTAVVALHNADALTCYSCEGSAFHRDLKQCRDSPSETVACSAGACYTFVFTANDFAFILRNCTRNLRYLEINRCYSKGESLRFDRAFEQFVGDTSNERITYDYDKICLCNTDLCSIHDDSDSSGTERLAVQYGFVLMAFLLFGIHVNDVNVI